MMQTWREETIQTRMKMSRIEHLVGGEIIEVVVPLSAREILAIVSMMTTNIYLATNGYILKPLDLL